MTNWIYDKSGIATIIHDGDCFRSNRGLVIAWINGEDVYSLNGHHIGWFEDGVIYDSINQALGFLRNSMGHLPSCPGVGGTPGTPSFGSRPERPSFGGVPGKPGRGGWSQNDLAIYLNT